MDWEKQAGRYPRDPRLGHRPGISFIPNREKEARLKDLYTNQYGFIALNDEPNEEVDWKSDKLIVILGGSVAMGLGASRNSKTAPALLQKCLNERSRKTYQVVNGACGAYCSWQELIRFTMELSDKKPWMVISISSWNDFIHASLGNRRTGNWYKNHDRSIDDLSEILLTGRPRKKRKLFNKIKRLALQLQGKKFSEGEIQWGYDTSAFTAREDAALNYLHNMHQIKAVTEEFGGKFKCLIQPRISQKYKQNEEPNCAMEDIRRLQTNHDGFKIAQEIFYETIQNRKNDQFMQDLGHYDSGYFVDHCHLNDSGQALLAKSLIATAVEPLDC